MVPACAEALSRARARLGGGGAVVGGGDWITVDVTRAARPSPKPRTRLPSTTDREANRQEESPKLALGVLGVCVRERRPRGCSLRGGRKGLRTKSLHVTLPPKKGIPKSAQNKCCPPKHRKARRVAVPRP